jgi:hypothetical protein
MPDENYIPATGDSKRSIPRTAQPAAAPLTVVVSGWMRHILLVETDFCKLSLVI